MKLIFAQYLASLTERGELDVIMPDLLSEIGMTVLSRPSLGTKQYGVDVAAVGPHRGGGRALFLISIKPGDLRRSGWDTGAQSLRPSLNQILDVYVLRHIPKRYAALPVVIVVCLGGELHEDVKSDVEGFMERNTKDGVEFALWNGDRLSELLLTGVLRENALPATSRSTLRKSIALVDEPDVCFGHFCRFLSDIADVCKPTRPARLTAVRQMYLGLWTLYVWARDTENIDAPYRCSERAMLTSWPLVKDFLSGRSKAARHLGDLLRRLIALHIRIAHEFTASYVRPRAKIRHGLASSVPSHASLDINLKLFDVLSRVAAHGFWQVHLCTSLEAKGHKDTAEIVREELQHTAALLADLIQNNPILYTPIKDNQAIDINIGCLFLNRVGCDGVIRNWVGQTALATMFAYKTNSAYPCVMTDYRDLAAHPKDVPGYQLEATSGSILIPTLAVWAALTDDTETLGALADFVSGPYKHCTLQLWYPGPDTEEHIYRGDADHGLAATHIKIERACDDMLAPIKAECVTSAAYSSLSAVEHGLWPLLISASRHHRVPVPPHLWPLSG